MLGDLAENALRQSLIMSQGSLAIFFTRPIAGAITGAGAAVLRRCRSLTPWLATAARGPGGRSARVMPAVPSDTVPR